MCHHRHVVTLTAVVLLGILATAASAQSTQSGSVSNGVNKTYSFTPGASGQLTATLSWDNAGATLFLVMVCGTSDPQAYGVAAGRLDRLARLESGLIGLNPCVIGVSTVDAAANYRLSLQQSTGQASTVQTLGAIVPSTERPVDARLVEHANRILGAVMAAAR